MLSILTEITQHVQDIKKDHHLQTRVEYPINMHPSERVYTELNEWFYHDYDFTDLGYMERSLSLGLKESWQLLAIEESQENVPILMKKCMEYSLFEDRILNYLFPELGCVIFRIAMQNAIGYIGASPKGNELILELEQEIIPNHQGPYVFYMPIGPIKIDDAY